MISPSVARKAHQELRDVYVAAITAARNFSIRGQSDQSAEAMGLARDAIRARHVLEAAALPDDKRE